MIRPAQPCDLAAWPISNALPRNSFTAFDGWAADGDPLPLADLTAAQAAGLLWVASRDDRTGSLHWPSLWMGICSLVEMSGGLALAGAGAWVEAVQAVLAHTKGAGRWGRRLTTDANCPGMPRLPTSVSTSGAAVFARPQGARAGRRPTRALTRVGAAPCIRCRRYGQGGNRPALCQLASIATKSAQERSQSVASG